MEDNSGIFSKQRRNLVIISTIILFYEISDANFTNTARLPFADIKINDTKTIEIFLHAFFIYFFWRYITCFLTSKDYNEACTHYNNIIKEDMSNRAFAKARRYLDDNKIKFDRLSSGHNFKESGTWYLPIENISGGHTKKGALYNFTYQTIEDDVPNSRRNHHLKKPIKIYGTELIIIKAKRSFFMYLFHNMFLEFYFPFLLAVLAIFETLDINIASSMAHLFYW